MLQRFVPQAIIDEYSQGQVLLIDKPVGWTSFEIVKKIRNRLKKVSKVGHAGTLDPLASGLLIVCTGKFTKQIDRYQAAEKEYLAQIELGRTTPSFDLETESNNTFDISDITCNKVNEAVNSFMGTITQIPPIYSAKKIDGKRLYEHARTGNTDGVVARPIEVTIHQIEVVDCNLPLVTIRVLCSKGTFIRTLASDIGAKLNNGAVLVGLRRTKIGEFSVENALSIDEWVDAFDAKCKE